jgi:TolB protein
MRKVLLCSALLLGVTLGAWSPPAPLPDAIPGPTSAPQQTEVRATIDGRSARLPRLAIATFSVAGDDPDVQAAAKTMGEVLWKDLEFEREFQMVGQATAASIPAAPAEALAYDLWNQAGADDVLVGLVQQTDAAVQVEIRVMNVERKISTFGKRYTCSVRNIRQCAHTVSDELHKERFGLDGVARTRLAFASDRDGERMGGSIEERSIKEIYIADYDGFGPRRITVRGSLNIAPSWAPDGRAIAYQSHQSGFVDVYLQKLYEVGLTRPARGTDQSQNFLPKWSPDGTRIVFANSTDGNWDVYVMRADGSDRRRLTSHPGVDSSPTWSPNGQQIAFASDRGGSNQIYIMSADGGPVEKMTSEGKKADRPTWALDFIAYSAEVPGGVVIKKVNVDTRQITELVSGQGNNESPAVAPNGRHIAFATTRWGKEQIAIVDADGRNVRQVTFNGNNRYPSWSTPNR